LMFEHQSGFLLPRIKFQADAYYTAFFNVCVYVCDHLINKINWLVLCICGY